MNPERDRGWGGVKLNDSLNLLRAAKVPLEMAKSDVSEESTIIILLQESLGALSQVSGQCAYKQPVKRIERLNSSFPVGRRQ